MPPVTITLTDEEQIRLEEILIDRDEEAALQFLKQAVKRKIEHHLKAHCKPPI